jgi:hypothetical protein
MEVPSKETVELRFGKGKAVNRLDELQLWLSSAMETDQPLVLLLMSSGNLAGLDLNYFTKSNLS